MKISIISCGWLGLPLGKYLATKGFIVKGATTTQSKIEHLQKAGITPFLLKLNPEIVCENFDELIDSELLIINIPPRAAAMGESFHLQQIQNLTENILNNFQGKILPKVIFISSTSVYPEANQIATETSEVIESHQLVKVENLLKETFQNLTILRFGGLMGYDRYPGKYYAGKTLANWATGVNYIHRDDAITLIYSIIDQNIWNKTYNVCTPIHPSRKEILQKNCEDLGIQYPIFTEKPSLEPYKIISPEKLIFETGFQFKYANPLDFFYQKEN